MMRRGAADRSVVSPRPSHAVVRYPPMQTALSLTGASLLFVGPFAPIIQVPILGSLNYFGDGRRDGILVVVLAAIAGLLCAARWFKAQAAIGLVTLGLLVYFVREFMTRADEVRRSTETSLAGNPFAGIVTGVLGSAQIEWGAAVIALGAVLLIVAAIADIVGSA